MATRANIEKKYGIVRLADPKFANQELSPEEAKYYEAFIQSCVAAFEKDWGKDESGEIE